MIGIGVLTPHPPIMVEGIGKGNDLVTLKKTREAMEKLDQIIETVEPETLVVFTPHGAIYRDAVIIYSDPQLSGDLRQFGLDQSWSWPNDLELGEAIVSLSRKSGLPVYMMRIHEASAGRLPDGLDHGVLAPLSFLKSANLRHCRLVVIPLSYLPLEELYQFGAIIQEAANLLNRKVAVVASGDLSHCLQPGAPAGFRPEGAEFDRKIVELINQNEVKGFFEIPAEFREKAAECGFRSIIMLLGTLDGIDFKSRVHSYEGPFGVGYAVASFIPEGKRRPLVNDLFEARRAVINQRRSRESALVQFARGVVEAYVKGEILPKPHGLDEWLTKKAGAFVSIKKHGELRGCIGTTEPTQDNLVLEVQQNAISAASRDPRFEPVAESELEDLVYSVDILSPAEPVAALTELDPERYGVIVRHGSRTGLLLPNLEGVDTVEDQVAIAKKKAGIAPDQPVQLERFEVVRYY